MEKKKFFKEYFEKFHFNVISVSGERYKEYLDIAINAVQESGKILIEYFGRDYKIDFKTDNSPVTIADTESEKKIIDIINTKFPEHSILGEESGTNTKVSDYLLVIDPLDGTSNYSNNIPFFCISIALLYKKNPIVATVYDPIHKDLFTAYKGGGMNLNGIKVTLQTTNPKTAYISLVYTRKVDQKEQVNKIFTNLNPPKYRMRNIGAAALELAYVASGKLHGIFINGNNPWDVNAGILLIQEAGGKVTDFNNNLWSFKSSNLVAGPENVHKQLLQFIS